MLKRVYLALIISFAMIVASKPSAAEAQMVSPRVKIATCYNSGAFNPQLMQMCSGFVVNPVQLDSCMRNGPCFGSPPFQPFVAGSPFCGVNGAPACPLARPCGSMQTIPCPPPPGFPPPPFLVAFGCGAMGTPPCATAVPCGVWGGLPCAPPPIAVPTGDWGGVFQFQPQQQSLRFVVPSTGVQSQLGTKFAAPPIPNIAELRQCANEASNEDELMGCMMDRALPPNYRLTLDCLDQNSDDAAAAFVCSANNDNLTEGYEKFKEISSCVEGGDESVSDVALCIGEDYLGQNERYYLGCVTRNSAESGGINYGAAVACGLAKDLNPEQQIAVDCAVKTGGQPKAFAICAGGRLMAREVEKCWQGGIATDGGCFGPNNEFRKFADSINNRVGQTFGQNSVVAEAYSLWHNNVLAPGPNHAMVRAANTVIGDLRNGPGPNNEFVKFGNAVSEGFKSVGSVFGF